MTRAPVAIVGIGCRFPGGISDPEGFWRVVSSGTDVITEFPPARTRLAGWYDPRPATPGRMSTKWGGFLDRIDEFDAAFFEISPREAERLDPQQRLLLETVWEALEDFGVDITSLEGSRTGVYVGQWLSDFESVMFSDPQRLDLFGTTGSGRYATSGRISFALGLHGPSLTIDTACSSSLAAVHLASKAIMNGECELALAGGVNVILEPHITIAYSQSRMMALDGRCKFGDAAGDGYVRSEGAGVVVLKALDRAVADGDRIYAVIRGSAINNDGRSSGSLGTPSRLGQEDLLRAAFADADVAPSSVGYVEAHGTGTRVGDPVEIGALASVLAPGRSHGARCMIGSVKTNLGHTEGAAGIAGVIKTALALHHGRVPASLHFRNPNPLIPWNELPFDIPRALTPWPSPRVAGVNSFGIAGTNAHVVLGEAPKAADAPAPADSATDPSLLVLSARAPEALRALAAAYADLLERSDAPALADVCWSAATRRAHLEFRAAFPARGARSMVAALRHYATGGPAAAEGRVTAGPARVAFVFPGQGGQWPGMARGLIASQPVFRDALVRCDAAARAYVEWSIMEQLALEPSAPGYLLDRIDVIQPVLVALALAYAELWKSLGVQPDAIVGHSMGEVGAAHAAGAIGLDEAMRIICARSGLMRRASGKGAMALVELPVADTRALLEKHSRTVSVAVSNSPRTTVISGDPEAIDEIIRELEAREIFCRKVKVDVAAHSPQMAPFARELREALAGLATRDETVPLYSTVKGERIVGTELGAEYWARNLTSPVLFGASVDRMLSDGITSFIELGPHPVLLESIRETAGARDAMAGTVECGRRETPDDAALVTAAGALFCNGVAAPLERMLVRGRFVPLPRYPWQRERYWADSGTDGGAARQEAGVLVSHPWFRQGIEVAGTTRGAIWGLSLDSSRTPFLADHRVQGIAIASASVYVESALAALEALGGAVAIRDLRFERALIIGPDAPTNVRLTALTTPHGESAVEWNRKDGDAWITHARAILSSARTDAQALPPVADVQRRIGTSRPADAVYGSLRDAGVEIGGSLRAFTEAWVSADEALAPVAESSAEDASQFRVPPAALDTCFQLAATLGLRSGQWMPATLGEVVMHRAPAGPLWAYARITGRSASTLTVSAALVDTHGPVLELRDIRQVRPLGLRAEPASALFEMAWKPAPLDGAEANAAAGVTWVIIPDRAGFAEVLATALTSRGGRVSLRDPARPGGNDEEIGGDARIVDLRPLDFNGGTDLAPALHAVVAGVRDGEARRHRTWLITRGAHATSSQDEAEVVPAQAAAAALGRSIAAEQPDAWGGHIDLDPAVPAVAAADQLARALASRQSGAIRGGTLLHARLRRAAARERSGTARFRADASYLLTGGLGGIGLAVAQWMIARGARRIVILGRTPLPARAEWSAAEPGSNAARAIASIRALEAQGASVHYESVDVADERALRAFAGRFSAEAWPSIRGVMHAAGVVDDQLLRDVTAPSFANVLRPKVAGAMNLHAVFPELDHFVIFSSIAAIIPQTGAGSYAAANGFLDAFARWRNAQGLPALSIGWAPWEGVGFAAQRGSASNVEAMATIGVSQLTAEQGVAILDHLLGRHSGHVIAAPVDWTLFSESTVGRATSLAADLVAAAPPPAGAAPGAAASAGNANPPMSGIVRDALGRVLRTPPARIDPRKPFGAMGLTSIMAVELRNILERAVGRPLSATLAWNYPTIDALASYLTGNAHEHADAPKAEAPAVVPEAVLAVRDMADEEAVRLLRKKR